MKVEIVQEHLQQRLNELKKEFELGQNRLQEMDRQQAHVRETLLRISGAIQVLEELLAQDKPAVEHTPSVAES
jgi:predicted nuclease with TOPRIM domain